MARWGRTGSPRARDGGFTNRTDGLAVSSAATSPLADLLVETLREFRKDQLELRLKLRGPAAQSATARPGAPSDRTWGFHNLRHVHASQFIDAGVDIVTISKRLDRAKPDITLRIYAHLFQKDDGKAAAAINAALNR